MLTFEYRQSYNTPDRAYKLSYRVYARYSVCLHGLVCFKTSKITIQYLDDVKGDVRPS